MPEINSFYCHPIPALYDVITAVKINEVIRLIKGWPFVEKRLIDRRHQGSFDFRARPESGFHPAPPGGKTNDAISTRSGALAALGLGTFLPPSLLS